MAMDQLTLQSQFSELGFVRVREAFPRPDAEAMSDVIWEVLQHKFGILKTDPSTWDRPFRKAALEEVGHSSLFWNIFGDRLLSVIDDLLGEGTWSLPSRLGDFLITFPNATSWELPHEGMAVGDQRWHSDEGHVPGVLGFVFLNDVDPRGGGTLIVQGSHRLLRRDYRQVAEPDGEGRKWKHRWEADHQFEWLRDLRQPGDPDARYKRFVENVTVDDGVPLQVVELTGKAGDAVLCDPWLIHSAAPNALTMPRFMRTPRIRG